MKDIGKQVDEIMDDITEDSNLCIIRNALTSYLREHTWTTEQLKELFECQNLLNNHLYYNGTYPSDLSEEEYNEALLDVLNNPKSKKDLLKYYND